MTFVSRGHEETLKRNESQNSDSPRTRSLDLSCNFLAPNLLSGRFFPALYTAWSQPRGVPHLGTYRTTIYFDLPECAAWSRLPRPSGGAALTSRAPEQRAASAASRNSSDRREEMSYPKRCEFRGAIYLLTLGGHHGGHVFYDPQIFTQFPENPRGHAPEAVFFEELLWDACEQYDAWVHAYVIEPNAAMIVLQTLGGPLGWVAHDLLARYSRYLVEQKLIPGGTKPFPRRYKAQIVQPMKLPYAVRYVQRRDAAAGQRRRMINHPFSSSLIYCGRRSRPEYFVVSAMREALAPLGYLGPNAYFEFMAAGDSPSLAHMLSQRVIGEQSFVDSVRARCRKPARTPSADEILQEVTGAVLHAGPEVASTSTHLGALARALVAWYAMRTGTAQISAVARWFDVTSADLRYLIRTHRRKNPQYFSKSLSELFPALAGREGLPQPSRTTMPGTIPARAFGVRAAPE